MTTANTILTAAKNTLAGRFSDTSTSVLIAAIWLEEQDTLKDAGITSLNQLKEECLKGHQAGALRLSRCDLVEGMAARGCHEYVAPSATQWGPARFHMVNH
jgi:hypothetical protein